MNNTLKILLCLLVSFQLSAQDNVFLSRDYWATNPSIKDVKQKISEGNDATQLTPSSFDGVVFAIMAKAPLETIKYLLSLKGNDVNKKTHDGRTYIFWSASAGNSDLMEYLLKEGAKTDILDDHGYSVLNFAANGGVQNTKVYDLCLAQGIDPKTDLNHDGANALLLAAPKDNDLKLIDYFTSKGVDINSTDKNGNGVFNYVARSGNTKLMDKLLQKGIKGNDQAFLFAAYGGRGSSNSIEVYKYLESKGLSPRTTNQNGETPLHIVAGRNKDIAILEYLLSKGLSVNDQDNNGNTPFINAASRNSVAVLELLSKTVNNVNQTNKKNQTALLLAAGGNEAEAIQFLIDKGANIDTIDKDGNNLTYYLINSYSPRSKAQFPAKLEVLKKNGLDISTPQKNGNTWYHLAVEKNSSDLLKLGSGTKIDINAKNNEGNTALLLAAMKAKDDKILKFLLQNGADKNITTDFEETAYDLAKENELLKANNISIEFLK
ncbi:MAG: ankyrin repeat domain-containing protein [Aestuariibaculum sp.]